MTADYRRHKMGLLALLVLTALLVLHALGYAQEARHEGRDVYVATDALAVLSHAQTVAPVRQCTVEKVFDGDFCKCKERKSPDRMLGIDSPEIRGHQPGATESRDALRALILGKTVTIEARGFDTKWKRRLVLVKLDGKDIGLEQVRAGNAWFFAQYGRTLNDSERKAYADAQAEAKAAGRGIWAVEARLANGFVSQVRFSRVSQRGTSENGE